MRATGKSALPELTLAAQKETDAQTFRYEIIAIAMVSSVDDALLVIKESLSRSEVDIRVESCEVFNSLQRQFWRGGDPDLCLER